MQCTDEQSTRRAITARRRAETYQMLADVFNAEPTVQMLDSLKSPEAAQAFLVLEVTFAAQLDRMEADLGKDRLVEELECEYTQLFIGPGKHVGPYESLHRDDNPPGHWGPSTAQVKRFIEHHGLSYDERFQGMPDHISAEFQFIAMLADMEANALERGNNDDADQSCEIQRTFHQDHIARWVPAFCDKVVEAADLDFYRDFARLAKAVVEADTVEPSSREES